MTFNEWFEKEGSDYINKGVDEQALMELTWGEALRNAPEKAAPNSEYKQCKNCKIRIENCGVQVTCISKGFLYWQHA